MELKVGDRVYKINREGKVVFIEVIVKVTKTKATANSGTEFKRQCPDWGGVFLFSKAYTAYSYAIETTDLICRAKRQNIINKITQIKWDSFDSETIERVLKIVQND